MGDQVKVGGEVARSVIVGEAKGEVAKGGTRGLKEGVHELG